MFSLLLMNFLGVFVGRYESQKPKLSFYWTFKKMFVLQITSKYPASLKGFILLTKLQQLKTEKKSLTHILY